MLLAAATPIDWSKWQNQRPPRNPRLAQRATVRLENEIVLYSTKSGQGQPP